jgi:hypothetical protein
MNKLKLFTSVLLSLFMSGVSIAQFGDVRPEDIDQFHDRTLIVIIEKPSDLVTQKLNQKHKTDQADVYNKAVDEYNKDFSDAITQYWKVSGGDIQYKTLDEVNDITDKKNYAVMYFRSVTQEDMFSTLVAKNGLLWWPDIKEVAHDKDFANKMTVMGMILLDKINKTPMYQFPVPDLFPTKADIYYAVNAANNFINYRINHRKDATKKMLVDMLQENQQELRDKTLLLRRDWLDKRLTKELIDKYYPYPYMIAGKDTVERAIDSANSTYAVAMVTPYDMEAAPNGALEYVQFAYCIEDGAIAGSSGIQDMPSDPKAGPLNPAGATKPLITKRTLLDFCQYLKDSSDDADKEKKKGGRK